MKKSHLSLILIAITISTLETSCKKSEEETNPFGTGNGSYSFWNKSDFGVGNIDVYVDGQTVGTMSHYFPDGVDCGKSDVNFVKKAGTYSWNAASPSGATWKGSITIEEKKCSMMELTYSGGGTGGNCSNSLVGTWTRQNDGGCSNSTGMKVSFSNGRGIIQYSPSNGCQFSNGQVKWRNFNPANCTIEDLNMPSGNFVTYDVTFLGINSVRIGSITYSK